ncbi:MAG: hypothetical protein JNM89_03835 [Hyphomicrobiaceae bacterium]|nr:hypothetical protein [Hyphomicrobiaceae bacterium]
MPYYYRVHGLTIDSDIELAELPSAVNPSALDVTIRIGNVAGDSGSPGCWVVDGYEVKGRSALFEIAGTGRYLARDGQNIVVDPLPQADPGAVRLYLLGSALGAILHQRGLVPLHASAFERNGVCAGFLGHSGAGKSTLAAMLMRRGYRLVSDDVMVIRENSFGAIVAVPGVPLLKLWPDSLALAGLGASVAQIDTPDDSKLRLEVKGQFETHDVPLRNLYVLRWMSPESGSPELVPLPKFSAMMMLRQNVYRPSLIDAFGSERAFLTFASRLIPQVSMFEFHRSMRITEAEEQVDTLLEHLQNN